MIRSLPGLNVVSICIAYGYGKTQLETVSLSLDPLLCLGTRKQESWNWTAAFFPIRGMVLQKLALLFFPLVLL